MGYPLWYPASPMACRSWMETWPRPACQEPGGKQDAGGEASWEEHQVLALLLSLAGCCLFGWDKVAIGRCFCSKLLWVEALLKSCRDLSYLCSGFQESHILEEAGGFLKCPEVNVGGVSCTLNFLFKYSC